MLLVSVRAEMKRCLVSDLDECLNECGNVGLTISIKHEIVAEELQMRKIYDKLVLQIDPIPCETQSRNVGPIILQPQAVIA